MRQELCRLCTVLLVLLVGVLRAMPQERTEAPAQTPVVPRLVKFSGALKDSGGKPLSGVAGVTFSIYKDPEGGAALWMETQNVQLDDQGRYTVQLGTTKNEGIPVELFNAAESRWLAVQVNLPGEVEQPRVLLVSVPYALKAADADTVGGMPASAFALAAPNGTDSGTSAPGTATQTSTNSKTVGKASTSATTKTAAAAAAIGGGGSPNVVTKFDATGLNVINSSISDNGSRITAGEGIDFSSDFSFVGNANPAATGRVQMFDRAFVGFVIRGLNVLFETLQGSPAVPTEVMRVTQAGNVGIGTTAPAAKLDVAGTGNFTGNTTAFSTAIVSATQSGSNPAPFTPSPSTVPPVAVGGIATATSGTTAGVGGIAFSPNAAGVGGLNFTSTGGSGVYGFNAATSGHGSGIQGEVASADGVAGVFINDVGGVGSTLLLGVTGTSGANTRQFRVDGTGKGFFNGGTQTGGADFAESVAVRGERSQYEPGDLLVIDQVAGRRLMLSRRVYSTRVAGIYSIKPGVLATIHSIDESAALAEEIPLAIVGIVPCKVTAENGSIAPGDLLVTSSTAGYAMKGTNRIRMLGAVVGKALEPLREGKGVIQVLVTLQ